MSLLGEAHDLQDELVDLRRRLHAQPEIGLELPHTQQAVLAELDGLGLTVAAGSDGIGSVVAVLHGGRPGGSVLLRADMDALPIVEQTGLDFAATNGAMHACGHDLHATMLVGAAKLLCARQESLAGDVVLMFQPGEEGFDGALRMIQAGVLEAAGRQLDGAYALHVTSSIYGGGDVVTRPGPFMAAAAVLRVSVRGAGGHASTPHHAKDPIAVAAEMVGALQTMVTRQFDVFDPVVVTVGAFHAGTQHNIIPERADFVATVRSFSPDSQARIRDTTIGLCRGLAAAHGLHSEVEWEQMYPVTVNDESHAKFYADVARELFGDRRAVTMRTPMAGSEDFSRVLNAVPGAMAFLGACPPDADPAVAPFNHSAYAVFDEAVLGDGAALYAQLAIARLEQTSVAPT